MRTEYGTERCRRVYWSHNGERSREESAWSWICSCGAEECGSTKAIAEEEWRSHKAKSEKALLERKRRLIGVVISQLKHDLTDRESFEEAPLEELFSSVPEEVLISYLPSVCNHREHGVYGQADFLRKEE